MSFTTILIAILIAAVVVLYLLWQTSKEKNRVIKEKNEEYKYTLQKLNTELSMLKELDSKTSQIGKEADEKIKKLHTGDAVSNAINGLCKH